MEMEPVDKYISTHAPADVKWKLEKWLQATSFRAFAKKYKSKIKRKLSKPTAEEIIDSLAELEAAYLLICQGFEVEYEKYGESSSPDLSALRRGTQLNAEVRRVRHSDDEVLLYDTASAIKQGIEQVPSPFMVILDLGDLEVKPGQKWTPMLQGLRDKFPVVIQTIADQIDALMREGEVPPDVHREIKLKHIFSGIKASICRPRLKTDHTHTSCSILSWPILHTYKEPLWFKDAIAQKLHKLRPGEPTFLLLIVSRDSPNPVEVKLGLDLILNEHNKVSHKTSPPIECLSGILVRPRWRSCEEPPNVYISNPLASHPLPDSLIKELIQMDC